MPKRHLTDQEKDALGAVADADTRALIKGLIDTNQEFCLSCLMKAILAGVVQGLSDDAAFVAQGDEQKASLLCEVLAAAIEISCHNYHAFVERQAHGAAGVKVH